MTGGNVISVYEAPRFYYPLAGDDNFRSTTGGYLFDLSDNTEGVQLTGGNFGDVLRGGSGDDTLDGRGGNDILEGGAGADAFDGGSGVNTVSYEHSTSAVRVDLRAGSGGSNDSAGDTYIDIQNLRGGSGDDGLAGDDNSNVIEGGSGADAIFGFGGSDVASYVNAGTGVSIDLTKQGQALVDPGTDANGDVLVGIESVTGSKFADNLSGDGNANALIGGGGNDTLVGSGGNDTLTGGSAADGMTGGAGNDTYFVDNAGDTVTEINGTAEGTDTLYTSIDYTLTDTLAIEVLRANAGSRGLSLTGNGSNNTLIGGNGNDTLDGSGGNDSLVGGAGEDTLTGGIGADRLNGGVGGDDMTGGTGNDVYYVDDADDEVHESLGEGTDTVYAATDYTLRDGEHVESLRAVDVSGLTLTGNERGNSLIGNTGGDTLIGGEGRDSLTGGAGSDTFVFRAAAESKANAYDTIVDFSHAEGDHIDLSQITTGRSDGAFVFNAGASFTGQAGELIAVQKSGFTLVQGDVDGNGTADFAIRVNGSPDLQSGDFVL